jgi:carboxypeptidase Taq
LRFREDEKYQGLAGTIHEGGHAIYKQIVGKLTRSSIDSALSMGTLESQSLFWERHVGLSKSCWKWATPILKETLDGDLESYTQEDIYGVVNAVSQSLIRVQADELAYPLRVILRYHISVETVNLLFWVVSAHVPQ